MGFFEWGQFTTEERRARNVASGQITWLHYAAQDGDLAECEALVAHGADVNALDNAHRTPLHWAVITDDRESASAVARYLIVSGADTTLRTPLPEDMTPMDLALQHWRTDMPRVFQEATMEYEAKQSKKSLLDGLDKPFIATEQTERPARQRRM